MDVQHAIERGIAAARANNQATAYYYFFAATQADPTNEQAWLWRASTAPQPRDALFCLAAVLALNPDNPVARHGLDQISAAVAAESAPATVTITPSLSGEYKPPERRLEWQQAFQRELYDIAQVPHLQARDNGAADGPARAGVTEAGGLAYRRPPGAAAQVLAAIRRVFVDRDTQRVQFAIPVVIVVVLLIGAVAVLGWTQLTSTPNSPVATPGGPPTSTVTGISGATPLPPTSPPAGTTGATAPTATVAGVAPASATPAAPATTAPAASATSAPPPPATPTPVPPPPPTPRATPSATTALPPPTPVPSGPRTVTVASGQTLQQVADQLGVDFTALWAFNDLTSLDVTAGQTLKVPPAGYKPTELRYAVQSGDNLTNIARLFGTTVDAISQRNGLTNPSAIEAGQVLVIPLP